MAQVSVRVNLVYLNRRPVESDYNVDWHSDKMSFEEFMLSLMTTLVTLEDESIFDKIDILGIDIIKANDVEKAEINSFKEDNDIKE